MPRRRNPTQNSTKNSKRWPAHRWDTGGSSFGNWLRGSPDAINLAATLADGQQVVVPAAPDAGPSGASAATAAGTTADPDAPISLGSATAEEEREPASL